MKDTAMGRTSEPLDREPLSGPFMTHHYLLGFRGRCGCGWEGDWRGYTVADTEADIAAHRCEVDA